MRSFILSWEKAQVALSEYEPNTIDLVLIDAAQRGEVEAFNTLVERHQRAVFAVSYHMLRDVQLAEDVTQDTFLNAWRAIGSFKGGMVRPWLLRIATNRTYDLLRSSARRPADSLDALPFESESGWTSQTQSVEHPEQYSIRGDLSDLLEAGLMKLPESQRLAIILGDVQGYSYDEIAEIMGIAIGTVKSRISRGRQHLREILRSSPGIVELLESQGRFPDS